MPVLRPVFGLRKDSAAHEPSHRDDKLRPQRAADVRKKFSVRQLPARLDASCFDGVDLEFENDQCERIIGVERSASCQSSAWAIWKTVTVSRRLRSMDFDEAMDACARHPEDARALVATLPRAERPTP